MCVCVEETCSHAHNGCVRVNVEASLLGPAGLLRFPGRCFNRGVKLFQGPVLQSNIICASGKENKDTKRPNSPSNLCK